MAEKMNLDDMLKSYKTKTEETVLENKEDAITETKADVTVEKVEEPTKKKEKAEVKKVKETKVSDKSAKKADIKNQKAISHDKKAMVKVFSKKKCDRNKLNAQVEKYFSFVDVKSLAFGLLGGSLSEYSALYPLELSGYDFSSETEKQFKNYFLPEVYLKACLLFGEKDMLVYIHRENILTGETECEGYKIFYSKISSIGVKHKISKTTDKKFCAKYATLSICFGAEVLLPLPVNSLTVNQDVLSAVKHIESKIK